MIQFKKLPFKIGQVWLISDTHYAHKNICKGVTSWDVEHSNQCRDFSSLEEMNKTIVDNINSVVPEDGLLIHDGDWSFGGKENVSRFREMINCKNIILIQGNHDHHISLYEDNSHNFMLYEQIGYYQVENLKFVCCHYPMSIWHQSHKDVPLFYGHVHGSFENVGKSMDVGIDNLFKLIGQYKPISLESAYKICMRKETFLESHHQKTTN